MSWLLDTNVVSELARPVPEPRVLEWFDAVDSERLFLSVLTLGEIRKGIEKLRPGSRRVKLIQWLEHELPNWFGPRILPIDRQVADWWGRLSAQAARTLPTTDSLLAATALQHELQLVTRNTKDFEYPGLEVVDPWHAPQD